MSEPVQSGLGQVASGSQLLAGPAQEGGADSAPAPAMAAPPDISAAGLALQHPSVSEGVASAGQPLQVSEVKAAQSCAANSAAAAAAAKATAAAPAAAALSPTPCFLKCSFAVMCASLPPLSCSLRG